jgi:hypothetical protein
MEFAYIDPTHALLELTRGNFDSIFNELITQTAATTIVPEPCELDESWKNFEKDLCNFKLKFKQTSQELSQKVTELRDLEKSSQISKLIIENVDSDDLKAQLVSVLDNYESEKGLHALTQQCGKLKGQVEAMNQVLQNTNAERYAQFTCFICMERNIELFIDPCGHVVCEYCWSQTRDKRRCPGCRTLVIGAGVKKIFTI